MTKCYSIKIEEFRPITAKAYVVKFWGQEETIVFPASQIYGIDHTRRTLSVWFSEWILEKKEISYSPKKWTMFSRKGKNIGKILEAKSHKPEKVSDYKVEVDDDLKK